MVFGRVIIVATLVSSLCMGGYSLAKSSHDVEKKTHQKTKHSAEHSNFKTTTLGDDLFLLQGEGGNIVLSKGVDGLVMIDADYKKNADALLKTLQAWPEQVTYLINTHWHFDHAGGNQTIGHAGATIIAHESVRALLSQEQKITFFDKVIPPTPKKGLPTLTFDKSMQLYANDIGFQLMHLPGGHTSGDVAIILPEQDILHTGDLFFNGMFPFVDVEHGGRVSGMIRNINRLLEHTTASTRIIPGHGPMGQQQDLIDFQNMLVGSRMAVKEMIDQGMSVQEAQKKGLPKQWASFGGGFLNEQAWISIVYASLQAQPVTNFD